MNFKDGLWGELRCIGKQEQMTGSVAVLSLISLQALVCAAPSLPVSPAADQPSTIPLWALVPLVVILAAIVISMIGIPPSAARATRAHVVVNKQQRHTQEC